MASGHIEKKDNNFYIVLELGEGADRKRTRLSVRKELGLSFHQWNALLSKDRKQKANELLIKKLNEIEERGAVIVPPDTTFGKFLRQWSEVHTHSLKPKTRDIYSTIIQKHLIPELGNIPIIKLRPSRLKKLYADKLKGGRADGKPGGLSPRTVQYMHVIIKAALNSALEYEIVRKNVAATVTPPTVRRPKIRYWTWDRAQQFLAKTEELKHRLYPLFSLYLKTGLRRGEALGLTWDNILWDRMLIAVRANLVLTDNGIVIQDTTKAGRDRFVEVSNQVLNMLRKWQNDQIEEFKTLGIDADDKKRLGYNLVFTSEKGTPVHPRRLSRTFQMLIEKAGLEPIGIHGLRHTHATKLLEDGVDIKTVQERLGHTRASTLLDNYSHVTPQMQTRAAAITDDPVPENTVEENDSAQVRHNFEPDFDFIKNTEPEEPRVH